MLGRCPVPMVPGQRRGRAEREQEEAPNHGQQTRGRGVEASDERIAGARQDRQY